jgi:ABC-2 type transport system permease protein
MSLYLRVFSVTLAEYFAYRLNFILWRFRAFVSLIIRYYLWLAVYESTQSIFGYTESQMLTYVLLSTIISSFVLATRTPDVAGQILNGDVINFLLKPFSFFGYFLTRDFADKLLNFIFSIFEVWLLFLLLKPTLFINTDPGAWVALTGLTILGCIIAFNINMLISFIAFWSPEVWAPRFIFFILVSFFSGGFFPLDILPESIYKVLLLTPFPYFYFIPTKIYMGYTSTDLASYVGATILWTILSSFIVLYVWKKGLKGYSFYGR